MFVYSNDEEFRFSTGENGNSSVLFSAIMLWMNEAEMESVEVAESPKRMIGIEGRP